jgi:hypothetical protein
MLTQALDDAFHEDGWGDIDPWLFSADALKGGEVGDAIELRATLQKAVDILNGKRKA